MIAQWPTASLGRIQVRPLPGADAARRRARERDEARARRRLWGAVAALGVTLGVAALFLFGVLGGEDDRREITFFGNRNDRSFNANIASGLDRAAREFDLELTDVPWAIDPGAELRELAESGPEIIFFLLVRATAARRSAP